MKVIKLALVALLIAPNLVSAEEYELVGINGSIPSKINAKGGSVGSNNQYIDPSGATELIIENSQSFPTFVTDITDTDAIVGSSYGRLSTIFGNYHPLRGAGFIDYPLTGSDELFDRPIFAIDKDNATGTCYNGSVGSLFSSAACGYVNGVFKLFPLTLDTSVMSNQEYLYRQLQSANAMNSSGMVVGQAIINYESNSNATGKNILRAFSWTQAGGTIDLGTLGGTTSAALDINSSNTIVGYADKSVSGSDRQSAFAKTSSGSMTEINLGDFQIQSSANSINDAGTVVGTVKRQDAGGEFTEAFIKSSDSNLGVELRTLTHPAFNQVKLANATDINNHGEIVGGITGLSTHIGYIARPLPTSLKPFPFTGGRSARATADYLIWRPSTGTWFALRPSLVDSTISYTETLVKQWGLPGDLPLFGTDFDGDNIDDLTVWRPTTGTWYSCLSSKEFDCSQGISTQFGLPGDIPLVADFDKDGKSDFVVYRRSLPVAGIIGRWYVKKSSNNEIISQQWGLAEDYPVQGDFNGDGYSDFAVFRPSSASWFVLYANQSTLPQTFLFKQFGLPSDHPVPRDIDADGATDIALFRPATGTWFSCVSSKEFACFKSNGSLNNPSFSYGLPSDYPIYRNVIGGETVSYAIWRPVDTIYANEGGWYTNIPTSNFSVSLKHWGLKSDIPAGVGVKDLLSLTGQEKSTR